MVERGGPLALRKFVDAVVTVGSDLDLTAMLHRLVVVATELVGAQYGALGVLDQTRTRMEDVITVGLDDAAHSAIGDLPEGKGVLGLLIVDAAPIRLPDVQKHPDNYGFPPNHPPMRSFLGVPIRVRGEVFGNLYLTNKTDADEFLDIDEELAVGLAAVAGVAIENARLHTRVHELAVVEDRERIARDLHDTVIQRLFATGLSLQATARMARKDPSTTASRIDGAVDDLDITIKHIRSAIFALESSHGSESQLRSRVMATLDEAAAVLGFEPHILFDGPVDSGVPDDIGEEMLAIVREALSNVTRHSQASQVTVELVVDSDHLLLRVTDDGIGIHAELPTEGRGLRNMAARAQRLGGGVSLKPGLTGGLVVEWAVPLP